MPLMVTVPTKLVAFEVFEHQYPALPPISYTFGQTLSSGGVVTKAAAAANYAFLSVLSGYATASFANELGQTAPLTASTYGAAGLTVNVTDANNSTTVVSGDVSGRFNTSGSTPAFLTSTAASVTFTPAFNPGVITYLAKDIGNIAVGGASVNPAGAPALMRAQFLAGLSNARARILASAPTFGPTLPSSNGFESIASGTATVTLYFTSARSALSYYNSIENPITCTVTGGVVATAAANGMFSTTSTTQYGYWQATAGTDTVFAFDTSISSFGCYLTDVGDVEGALTVYMLPDDGGAEDSIVVNNVANPSGTVIFFGFISHAKRYTRVRFSCATPVDSYGIDDVVVTDALMATDIRPIKAFGLYLTSPSRTAGTSYTATIVKSNGTTVTTIPTTAGQPSGGLTYWGFTVNEDATILSVTIASSNTADVPGFDDVTFGTPFLTA